MYFNRHLPYILIILQTALCYSFAGSDDDYLARRDADEYGSLYDRATGFEDEDVASLNALLLVRAAVKKMQKRYAYPILKRRHSDGSLDSYLYARDLGLNDEHDLYERDVDELLRRDELEARAFIEKAKAKAREQTEKAKKAWNGVKNRIGGTRAGGSQPSSQGQQGSTGGIGRPQRANTAPAGTPVSSRPEGRPGLQRANTVGSNPHSNQGSGASRPATPGPSGSRPQRPPTSEDNAKFRPQDGNFKFPTDPSRMAQNNQSPGAPRPATPQRPLKGEANYKYRPQDDNFKFPTDPMRMAQNNQRAPRPATPPQPLTGEANDKYRLEDKPHLRGRPRW